MTEAGTSLDFADAIVFWVGGTPKGQPRVKAFARKMGAKHVARVYTPDSAEEWKSAVARTAEPLRLPEVLTGPLRVDLQFTFPRPKSHYRGKAMTLRTDAPHYHTSTPDTDNLQKAVFDVLTDSQAFWKDDAQIADGQTTKTYGERPGCLIRITPLS